MEKYNPGKIEKKWQKHWEDNSDLFAADEKSGKEFYCLDMFPYPSGDGLHVGHVEGYTASDTYSRYLRMNGKNVLHPMGWDAFGLPAENYAIRSGVHPAESTKKNIEIFKKQIKTLGLSYDWSREIDTSDPDYYKWTQWFFLFLYEKGLAYRKKAKVNWCESCKTVLANEQVEDGVCERCKQEVIQKEMVQWFFRITDFAEDLIEGLNKVDWPESTKIAQKNWIGKSEGAVIKFPTVTDPKTKFSNLQELSSWSDSLEVFTTRLDTIYGCTYCVVAPEHPIFENLKSKIENLTVVEKYIKQAEKKTDLQRTDLAKKKTGVEIKGIKAVNPFTNKAVPIFVADYILATYGTGAVMAVPAHDERDFEFARKHKLPVKEVIMPVFGESHRGAVKRETISPVIQRKSDGKFLFLKLKDPHDGIVTTVIGGIEKGESMKEAAERETLEETGYECRFIRNLGGKLESHFYAVHKKEWRKRIDQPVVLELVSEKKAKNLSDKEKNLHDIVWLTLKEALEKLSYESDILRMKRFSGDASAFVGDGRLVSSGEYSGLGSAEAREKMAKWLEKNKLGGRKTTYKLRDWLISRQRYWGAPIPIIYCRSCSEKSKLQNPKSKQISRTKAQNVDKTNIDGIDHAIVPLPEKDLPVILPEVKDYRPKGTSPLGTNPDFVNVKCPKCGGKAKRETDTMDTFVCSSWYYFRFADPKNDKEFAARDKIKKWLPVNLYIGGAEHTVLHLLYSRFFTKALHKYKHINFSEPFSKLRHQGIVLAEDGRKMSKSLGNVINPDKIVREYGADTLRLYEMFMGPLEDSKSWNTESIIGLKRFLEKVWNYFIFYIDYYDKKYPDSGTFGGNFQLVILNQSIKKVTEDIENLRFNTAISQMMILMNELKVAREGMDSLEKRKEKGSPGFVYFSDRKDMEKILILLSVFAPHISEELWSKLGHKKSIFLESWPKYDPKLINDEEKNIIIQINGKLRDQIRVSAGASEAEVKKMALGREKVAGYIGRKNVKKTIFVKDKLINFVA